MKDTATFKSKISSDSGKDEATAFLKVLTLYVCSVSFDNWLR